MMRSLLVSTCLCGLLSVWWTYAAEPKAQPASREKAQKLFSDGNFAEAYTELQQLLSEPATPPDQVVADLSRAVESLQRLGRIDEIDALLVSVTKLHAERWQVLHAAAMQLAGQEHFGHLIAGEFARGHRRGGGPFVNSLERDRVQAMIWLNQALPLVQAQGAGAATARYYVDFSRVVQGASFNRESWKLQLLTALDALPDYDPMQRMYYGGSSRGAPVTADGNPLLYSVPKSFTEAANDGERWRSLMVLAQEADAQVQAEVTMDWARFLETQFGVETLAGFFGRQTAEDLDDAAGPFAVHTLADDETIARLATGPRRFKLTDEFHPIAQYRRVVELNSSNWSGSAANALATIFENRRQYVRAAESWKSAIERFGADGTRQERLDQIVKNWGQFEGTSVQPAGDAVKLGYRFRNAKSVNFTAQAIKVSQLLDDVKAYLRGRPAELDWQQLQVSEIGYRLVAENQTKYLSEQVAQWELGLEPKADHVDRLIDVTTPLKTAGAYLVTATLADGNVSRIIVWVADTALVKKQLDGKVWLYVADAVTGSPVEKANVEFFGWRQQFSPQRPNRPLLETRNFAEFSAADGQLILGQDRLPQDHQWLIMARTDAGRLAYLGFTGVWYPTYTREEYEQRKAYLITDRPVYRPGQSVQFKIWLQQAKYDQPDQSPFARQSHTVIIHNPQGEKVHEQKFTTDDYGGLNGSWPLGDEAMLGQYQIYVENFGGGSFRVEEYKKPEYEVTVDAPAEPVQLGDTITATIRAKYYFGTPVTQARVKYKVERSTHSARWYPAGPWDWFYGRGYRWQGYDYTWYPGFARWGCLRPAPFWWSAPAPPPELVSEQEVDIGPDGTVQVTIDTLPAKEAHSDQDHSYRITAEVVDQSRRTIVGTGNVLVARQPFQVTTWIDRGYYQVGDTITARAAVYTLDQKPVAGKGKFTLYRIQYNAANEPQETSVGEWEVLPNAEGQATQQLAASEGGQYRLAYKLTDAQERTQEGAYVFLVRGEGFDGRSFQFNNVELVTDKSEYAPGDMVKLLINTRRADGTVALFLRPSNGVYQPPQILKLNGKSTVIDVPVATGDMPNFFVEACTVADGAYHFEAREVVVPPAKRVLNVTVEPSQKEYLPGAPAEVALKLTDAAGKPFVGSTVVSVYDRSVDYIAGGSNVPEIREFFWKWRRHHHPQRETNLDWSTYNLLKPNEIPMSTIGIFGNLDTIEHSGREERLQLSSSNQTRFGRATMLRGGMMPMAAPAAAMADGAGAMLESHTMLAKGGTAAEASSGVEPTVRTEFADTAYWNAAITTDADGTARLQFPMPENLTAWKIRAWGMGRGTQVGEGTADVVTRKNILVRLQAPRFFVETDEVVLSAIIHNDLAEAKQVTAVLELDGGCLASLKDDLQQTIEIAAHGEHRVDWRVKAQREGTAVIRMKALTDVESDAMQQSFPVYVHGMLKTESFSRMLRPSDAAGNIQFTVPAERRADQSRVEVRFSPTLAGAMVDALPYLVEYPYGCTEQTLNRFLPTVITQRILQRMKIDLKDVQEKRNNLNAQQLGNPADRAAQWKRFDRNPVFDEAEVVSMVKSGVDQLTSMQLSDGGWGWFSGFGERAYPHTTAVVVHGLQVARQNDVALVPGVLENGIAWLQRYQTEQVQLLKNAPNKTDRWKSQADAIDAFIYMILADADIANADMREFLFRDRLELPVYAKALFGLALHKQQQTEQRDMLLQNLSQFVVEDDENQTAYLRLPENGAYWYWYGSDIEANAYFLKLLTAVNPQDARAPKLVKYLLNNRSHGSYWKSTRDTALCIEALADYLIASGEAEPELAVEIWLDGQKQRDVKITASNLFTFDNTLVLQGDAVTDGNHTLEFRKTGSAPLYINAYVTNFTREPFITAAGLEVKVARQLYKLTRDDKQTAVEGSRGQALLLQTEKYTRTLIANESEVTSGDLIEVELEIDSKNDYEYLVFEDLKGAGFEAVDLRSGYTGNALGAYIEYRDERTALFVRSLPRGKHSVSYRLRAEIPGKFSVLPARAAAMYAPELRANSDELKVGIIDR